MDDLIKISKGLNMAYPDGNEPFQMITRLAEECGELAKEVNHWERTGIKVKKYGEPNKDHLAKEIQNVLTCALQVAIYYGVEPELEEAINNSFEKLKSKGFI